MHYKFLFILLGLFFSVPAFSDVNVSDRWRFEVINFPFSVQAGHVLRNPLIEADVGDRIEVAISSTNQIYPDISAYICRQGNPDQDCLGFTKKVAPYVFHYDVKVRGQYLIQIDNSYSALTRKKGAASIYVTKRIPYADKMKMTAAFKGVSDTIFNTFNVDKFTLNLEPCGQENAFSQYRGGHITICTELFMKLLRERKEGALFAIIFHEIGHSLLNLWGMPNWKNEETVDEFALTMMYWEGIQEKAHDWIRYFEEQNSVSEANIILLYGDTHPVSIQRARNIKANMDRAGSVVARWNKFLYPHLTSGKLRNIINNAGRYGDPILAKQILSQRKY